MGCCGSKPKPEELPLADVRELIERAPPEKKEELERVAGLKEGLSKAVSDIRTMARADAVVTHLMAGLGEFPKEVWAWPEGKRYLEEMARMQAASVPKTNESIRQAVAEFKAESADFRSPTAEGKWGPLAYWNVSEVTDMSRYAAAVLLAPRVRRVAGKGGVRRPSRVARTHV